MKTRSDMRSTGYEVKGGNHMKRNTRWMRNLAFHYEAMKDAHPDDKLMIVFDIDGTILDFRRMVLSVFHAYDHDHGTKFFQNLSCMDITSGASDIGIILREFALSPQDREDIASWCDMNFRFKTTERSSYQPFPGVMDVIRWFQMQPNTFVGLNSGRTEQLRLVTLHALNVLGEEYHVAFDDSLLFMNSGLSCAESKIEGLLRFKDLGYRIIAVIDNEKDNLKAISETNLSTDMLLLHADAFFDSSARNSFEKKNNLFDLTDLIPEHKVPEQIEFVWHGVDDEETLRKFLVSSVGWAELHVRLDAKGEDLIVRRKRFAELPPIPGEQPDRLEDFLYILEDAGRGVKLDLKDPGLTERVLKILKTLGFTDERIWITINMEEVDRGGLKLIMSEFPKAIKQFPVDSLAPMMNDDPDRARDYFTQLSRSGIDRFSVDWKTPDCRRIITLLQSWGFEVNIYNVPDLESFLQASLLLPKSITSYFNFPKWFYTGRNNEEEGHSHWMTPARYSMPGS
jgi:hypothetical protein